MFPGAITDIAGLKVGHFTDSRRPTGCTVLLCEAGAVCGVDVRGAAPGTRETDLLHPLATLEQVHALLLTGGSAFGLAAADGVMRWLDERGHGCIKGLGGRDGLEQVAQRGGLHRQRLGRQEGSLGALQPEAGDIAPKAAGVVVQAQRRCRHAGRAAS